MKSYITLPLEENEYTSKLESSYLVITPFHSSLQQAHTHLRGVLNDCEIKIDNGIGKQIFDELFTLVKKKSEILISDEKTSLDKKSITSSQLQQIIKKGKEFEALKLTSLAIFGAIKGSFYQLLAVNIEISINSKMDELLKVYQDEVEKLIEPFELEDDLSNLIISKLYPLCSAIGLLPQDTYTIIIALIADKIRQNNDN